MKKLTLFIIFGIIITSSAVLARGVYYTDDGDCAVDVDKFVPQTGVKVKNSYLADKLENGTRNMREGKKGKSETQPTVKRTEEQQNTKFKRTYKWF